jgi:hypothetical protein
MRHRPRCLLRLRVPVSLFLPRARGPGGVDPRKNVRGSGAPSGAPVICHAPQTSGEARLHLVGISSVRCRASRRSTAAILGPRTMRGGRTGVLAHDPASFHPRSYRPVLPLKASPRNRRGWRPGASRTDGASIRAGAAPAPPTERLMMAPPDEQTWYRLAELANSVEKNEPAL